MQSGTWNDSQDVLCKIISSVFFLAFQEPLLDKSGKTQTQTLTQEHEQANINFFGICTGQLTCQISYICATTVALQHLFLMCMCRVVVCPNVLWTWCSRIPFHICIDMCMVSFLLYAHLCRSTTCRKKCERYTRFQTLWKPACSDCTSFDFYCTCFAIQSNSHTCVYAIQCLN